MSRDCLRRQVEEIEALAAVYSDARVVLSADERAALDAARRACSSRDGGTATAMTPGALGGTLRLEQQVSLRFALPAGYPALEPPQLSVECGATRAAHDALDAAARACAAGAVGEESLLLAAQALEAEAASLLERNLLPAEELPSPSTQPHQPRHHHHLRVIIWFHHIKNLGKRKNLVAWARELRLLGRSKPGFPGLVVVEGAKGDVREYVARVRALQWQAMQVRGEQEVAAAEPATAAAAAAADGGDTNSAWGGVFAELPEHGTAGLGRLCAAAGCEALFLAALKL